FMVSHPPAPSRIRAAPATPLKRFIPFPPKIPGRRRHCGGIGGLSKIGEIAYSGPCNRGKEGSLLALCLLLGLQEEVIQRSDPARSQYQEAVELCKAAEELLERDPEAAATKLTELLDRFGQLPKIERRLRIKVFADDAGAPHAFFPYQLRGRARLAAAKDPDRIEAAVRDFERSVERGAASSKPLLQSARAAWWASLRP